MLLFLLVFLWLDPNVGSLPIEPKTVLLEPTPRGFDTPISSVVRKIGESDVFHPSACPSSCEHLHQALPYAQNHTDINFSIKECSCICPLSRPAYLSTFGGCVEKLSECQNTIRWKGINSPIPVVQLRPHSIILNDAELDFRAAGIRASPRGADEWNCAIKKIMYENSNTKWRTISKERGMFQLTSSNGKPIVYFGGTEFDASFLVGAVVMIKLDCPTFMSSESALFCISLRIAGTSGATSNFDHKKFDSEETGWRIETTLLFIIVAFIIAVLITTFIIWNICWGIKKRKLINDFQMQFVQQFKNQSQPGGLPRASNGMSLEEIDEEEILQSHHHPQIFNRKRLIFSAEYFDPSQMTHPSPVAIQFLYDLRRVIDVAKERIRERRFFPALPTIKEENETDYEQTSSPSSSEENLNHSATSSDSSPRVEQKSVDSGKEAKDGSDDEVENDMNLQKRDNELKIIKNNKVSGIVKSFEDMEKAEKPPAAARPSYVPIMLNSSMRKKKPIRVVPLAHVDSDSIVENIPSIKSRIKPPTTYANDRKSPRERKGYAVFPSDGTFNKSLPRRGKRNGPTTVPKPSTTNN